MKNDIIRHMLPNVSYDGWGMSLAKSAASDLGYDLNVVNSLFPAGMPDLMVSVSEHIDRQMIDALNALDIAEMGVTARIREGVLARLMVFQSNREAYTSYFSYYLYGIRKAEAAKIVWRASDIIWNWAGDASKDYNRYTKRSLLSGVLASTTLTWIDDKSADLSHTRHFLDNRINNVMILGKYISKIKKSF